MNKCKLDKKCYKSIKSEVFDVCTIAIPTPSLYKGKKERRFAVVERLGHSFNIKIDQTPVKNAYKG